MAAVPTGTFLTRRLNSVLSAVPSRTHFGYLPFEGRIPNDKTPVYVQKAQVKAINLKPVKRIHFKVDPIHPRSGSIRKVHIPNKSYRLLVTIKCNAFLLLFQLMTIISNEKVTKTGPKTTFKYEFVSDRSEPTMTLSFLEDERKAIFEMAFLTEHEAVYEMNKIVLPLVKDDTLTAPLETKGGKSKKGGKKR